MYKVEQKTEVITERSKIFHLIKLQKIIKLKNHRHRGESFFLKVIIKMVESFLLETF